ncbi:VOC family protein [Tychonema sp. LEGE 07203]|uniref:VOC family protein n=1 Tax=Tychonema sp. LEGE 07203 TaxID=1828671 RepID=UPI001882439D|nr:VOC family protein [Tychonema sp. LEGE 07203]MBE9094114.1 VOC family protein [Tychonema sp. LEGE 07203]
MQLNPYLFFNGNCETAFKFYEQCFGGKIVEMMTHGEAPIEEQGAPEWRDKILHACLLVGERELMGSDCPPKFFEETKGFSVQIAIDDPTEAERIFHALAENGTVKMPFGQTFWAFRFGMLVDRFGIPWMVNCEKAA